jgi:uncharacterized protein YbaR (Trm112 family)
VGGCVGGGRSVGGVGHRFQEKQLKIHEQHQNQSQKTARFTGDLHQVDGVVYPLEDEIPHLTRSRD